MVDTTLDMMAHSSFKGKRNNAHLSPRVSLIYDLAYEWYTTK